MFSLYLETIRKHSKKFSIAFVAIIITAIAELAPTYIIQIFIDKMVAGGAYSKNRIRFFVCSVYGSSDCLYWQCRLNVFSVW